MAALPNERPAAAGQAADAAHRLFVEYSAPLRRYCRGQLPSLEEAEDAVQSTFLRAFNALAQGVVPQHEAAWLYKIAHNVCLSRRLAATRRARVETPRDLDFCQDEPGAVSPRRAHEELMGLDDALANMPEKLRTPFLMREWQGLSYHEIAAELGVSHSAVETLIFRARKHLAGALEGTIRSKVKRVRQAFDTGGLLAGLKALFGGSAAALQAAAAVAVLAVGTGAASRALAAGTPERPLRSPAQELFGALAAPPVLQQLEAAAAPRPVSDTLAQTDSPAPASVVADRAIGGRIASADADETLFTPPVEAAGPTGNVTATHTVAPQFAPPERAAPADPVPADPAPAAPAPAAPQAPVVTPAAPAVSPPSVQNPGVPSVTVPTVTVPAQTTPAVTTPAVTTPAVTTPAATVPAITTPAVTTPAVTTPAVTTPAAPATPPVTPPSAPSTSPVSPPKLP